MEELMQRLRSQICNLLKTAENKLAFMEKMATVYGSTIEIMSTFMLTQRLHLSSWHLSYKKFFVHQFINLRKLLDTKAKKFFLR